MANRLRRYWDADCCFGFLRDQAGRAEACGRVLREAEAGRCEIVVSALTIAEVLHLKGERHTFPRAMKDTIRGFFRRSYFQVVNVDRFIAERAQDAFWDHSIQPKDAVHLAIALEAECHFLESYDKALVALSRTVGGDPQLVIQNPGADLVEKAAREVAEREEKARGSLFGSDFLQ